MRRTTEHIAPIVKERLRLFKENGLEWDGKPVCHTIRMILNVIAHVVVQNDLLQWLIDSAPCEGKRSIPGLVKHLVRVNNGSILTPSMVRGSSST